MEKTFCCIILKPCPSGEPLYIQVGLIDSAYALSWVPFVGNLVNINIDIYNGITWAVVGFCCPDESCREWEKTCLNSSIASIPISAVTQVGTGDCPTFKTNTCCINLSNCYTGATMSAVMNPADYTFWDNLISNNYTVDLNFYNISGTWTPSYICCNYESSTYGYCEDGSCSINNFYIDTSKIGVNETLGCPSICYQLTPCNGGPAFIGMFYNSQDVYEYLNTAITVLDNGPDIPAGTYYLTQYCTSFGGYCCEKFAPDVLIITDSYADCACFLGPEPVKYTRVIPKPDRFFYKIDQSQCDITANIQFGEAYYKLFKTLKYGIHDQCDTLDLSKVWIKKELSDYALMYDPTLCGGSETPTTNCADPCNLTR